MKTRSCKCRLLEMLKLLVSQFRSWGCWGRLTGWWWQGMRRQRWAPRRRGGTGSRKGRDPLRLIWYRRIWCRLLEGLWSIRCLLQRSIAWSFLPRRRLCGRRVWRGRTWSQCPQLFPVKVSPMVGIVSLGRKPRGRERIAPRWCPPVSDQKY